MTSSLLVLLVLLRAPDPAAARANAVIEAAPLVTTGLTAKDERTLRAGIERVLFDRGFDIRWQTTAARSLLKIEVIRLGSVVTWTVTLPGAASPKTWTDNLASLESPERLAQMVPPLAQPHAPGIAPKLEARTVPEPATALGPAPIVVWGLGVVGFAVAAIFGARAYNFHRDHGTNPVSADTRRAWLKAQQLEAAGLGVGGAAMLAGTAIWYFDWP